MTAAMNLRVPLSAPDIGERELRYVEEVMRSGQLSLGPVLPKFEETFAATIGRKFAVAVNSGTSALHLGVRAAEIGAGHEVITTSFSFVASTNCLLYEKAVPVFVDIDPDTLNISPASIREFLKKCCGRDAHGRVVDRETGREVKGILPVHVFGLPADMQPIRELADEYGLMIIEDSCEAIGATYRGRPAGTLGEMSCFAFYPNKQMTTGEGGMIVTDDERLAKLCRSMRNQGRGEDGAWLRHERVGYNYRLSDIHCALGLAQVERLQELLQKRERVARSYHRALEGIPYLRRLEDFPGAERSWFVYIVQLAPAVDRGARDRILEKLRSAGVGCQAYFPAIHRQPFLRDLIYLPLGRLRETEIAADRCLALPFFSNLQDYQIEYVAETLGKAVRSVCGATTGSLGPQSRLPEPESTIREHV
ncbi:MAG TPA: DegT/DnrJ/EryC1/StrS family aminotransferase [Candidatus Acidoferrum sp.]|nr:DegT/DnrJ/EryC1/StrS family aminotransferase [Candidatus Acidoferrum sp.]